MANNGDEMKNVQGYLIIGISIIIAAIVIVLFFPDQNYGKNDCYKKVYKHELKTKLNHKTLTYDKEEAERSAAFNAKILCTK
jgi:predicted membrane protein